MTPGTPTEQAVRAAAERILRVVRIPNGRLVISSQHIGAVYAEFGYDPRDFIHDPGARLVGDVIRAVQDELLTAAEETR